MFATKDKHDIIRSLTEITAIIIMVMGMEFKMPWNKDKEPKKDTQESKITIQKTAEEVLADEDKMVAGLYDKDTRGE